MLTVQYRMHELIMNWSSKELYDSKVLKIVLVFYGVTFCCLMKRKFASYMCLKWHKLVSINLLIALCILPLAL